MTPQDSRQLLRQSGRKQRWYWFSVEPTPNSKGGPFGPIEARTVSEANQIGEARARHADLTLRYVVAAYHLENTE